MKKGFSITISEQNTDIQSFISKDYDNFYFQSEPFDFLIEGVLLNKKKLLHEFALKDFETLIRELYFRKKEQIIKEFEGEFRGFIYDKTSHKIFVFTNATSTQRVFYGKSGNQIFIDTSLIRLNENLKNSGTKSEPDIGAVYQILGIGNMLENKTILKNVYKILDGHYLEIDCNMLIYSEKEHFNFFNKEYFSKSKETARKKIHEIFSEAVLMEYEKDEEFETNHLSLLSGGLDSRVAMLYALKNKKIPDNVLCFSQSGYFDERISRKISEDFSLHYEFVPLDGGTFLKKIDHLTELSEGLVFYTGGIHVHYAVEKMQYDNFSLFHSGQIGDGVLGGFNSVPERKKPSYFKIVSNKEFLPKIEHTLNESIKNYETEEVFLMRNVAFNRTLFGAHVLQQKRYQTSPFMYKDFLKFAVSLPEKWKFNHRFYLEWIREYCEEATQYRWERTLMNPDAKWKTNFGDKVMKRGFKILNEKILNTPQKTSMYPYQFYFDNEPEIRKYYQQYFDENIHRIESYPELYEDVFHLFSSGRFHHKSQAVNILSIFKLYF
ncbi:MAG: asparagine synthase-related protein [Bergeyella sp.]